MKNEIEIIFKNGAKIKTKCNCVHTVDGFIQIEKSTNHESFISIAKDEVLMINSVDKIDINDDSIFTLTPKSESFYEGWGKRNKQLTDYKKLNINSVVKVKLTDYGLRILREQHDELNIKCHHRLGKYCPPAIDINGYYCFQLWDLMTTFGEHIGAGCKEVFAIDIIIMDKDLREEPTCVKNNSYLTYMDLLNAKDKYNA